jgi:hypothetical protein
MVRKSLLSKIVRVRKAEDFGAGLEKIIGDLVARHSLGFVLDEREPDDINLLDDSLCSLNLLFDRFNIKLT